MDEYQIYIQISVQTTEKTIMSEVDVTDIEEAKLIISMKNDEIKSINIKMKTIQKKAQLATKQSTYRIQQQKNKIADFEKKMQKLKQSHQQQLKKYEESEQKLKNEISKLKQTVNQSQKNERQIERSYKAQIYEQQLHFKEQKQKRAHLKKQMEFLLKLFNPKQIISVLGLASIEDIVPYLYLTKNMQKIVESSREQLDQIDQLHRQMEIYKADSMKAMEQTFSKLSSYEQVMTTLREKNSELEQIMIEAQRTLQEKHYQLQQKSNMLKEVEAFTTQKYHEMNEQIENLRTSVQNYERQSLSYQTSKQEQEKNLKFIFELSAEFEQKQETYLHKIMDLELVIQSLQKQKQQISNEYHEHELNFKYNLQELQNTVQRSQKNLRDKEQIITMMNNNLKDMELEAENSKKELEKIKVDMSELYKKKKKLKEQLRQNKQLYESKQASLLQEIDLLKNYRGGSGQFKHKQRKQSSDLPPTSLGDELEPEPNWAQLYQNSLNRHNQFIRQIHNWLKKQKTNIPNKKKL